MRKFLLLIFLFVFLLSFSRDSIQTFNWFKNQKRYYSINNQLIYYLIKLNINECVFSDKIDGLELLDFGYFSESIKNDYFSIDKNSKNENCSYLWIVFNKYQTDLVNEKINSIGQVVYRSYFLKDENNIDIGISHLFYVKLKDLSDSTVLNQAASKYGAKVILQDSFNPKWHVLMHEKNDFFDNALELANFLYETNLFEASEPSLFSIQNSLSCVNDPSFNNQWNLKANQDYGIDVCDAWTITNGSSNIKIALYDNYFHPLVNDINALNNYSVPLISVPSGVPSFDHGTKVGSIIKATNNNNLLMAGVAPNCQLQPILYPFGNDPNMSYHLKLGFDWGVANGIDIFNCSWNLFPSTVSQILDESIENALNNGRNGKGCVIINSSGNFNSLQNYPKITHDDITCVGATNSNGIRWWGSNFGDYLDVVAPGENVSVIALDGNFNVITSTGTSFAAPHVTGIAGLILSIAPCLTQKQVKYIIEKSAKKNLPYSFNNNSYRKNGLWNSEVGYGLASAKSALDLVLEMNNRIYLQYFTESTDKTYQGVEIFAGYDVTNQKLPGNYTIPSGRIVKMEGGAITLKNGFFANSGSTVTIKGTIYNIENTNGCSIGTVIPSSKTDYLESDNLNNDNFSIFPNPSISSITIKGDAEIYKIEIFDMLGKKVFIENFNLNPHFFVNIDISNFRSGIFLVNLNDGIKTSPLKFIKQ